MVRCNTMIGLALASLALQLPAAGHGQETKSPPPTIMISPPPPISIAPYSPPFAPPDHFPAAVEALTDPASWVTTSDYPPTSLRERKEGRVGIEVTVTPYGRVGECRVVATSGTSELDDTACQMVTRRARFRPAYDADGKAISATYRNAVMWRMPLLPPMETFGAVFEYVVERDGSMTDCRVVSMTGGVAAALLANNPCTRPVRYKPSLDTQGRPVRRRVRLTYGADARDIP